MSEITAERTDSALPLSVSVTRNSGGVTGLTGTVQIRKAGTINDYLDFADLTFKTVGWTTKSVALTEVGGGFYALVGGVNIAGITNLPSGRVHLVAEYRMTGPPSPVTQDDVFVKELIEDGATKYTERDAQQIIAAAVAGKSTGGPAGFNARDLNDSKDVIIGTADIQGNRTAATYSP